MAETFHFIVVLLQALFLQPEIHQHAISLWAPAHALWEPLEESSKHKLPSEPLTLRRVSPFCFAWLGSRLLVCFSPVELSVDCVEVTGDPETMVLRFVMGLL